jgi:outer membrane protein, heavy metal efflux system
MRPQFCFLLLIFTWPAQSQDCGLLPAAVAGQLSLEVALERGRACHPDVRAAFGALAAAGADVVTSGQSLNPQLILGAGSVSSDVGPGRLWNKTFDHAVRVEQTIERGGKVSLRHAIAEAQREAARADLAEAQRRAALATAQAYYELAATLARRRETAGALELAGEAQKAQDLRVKTGDVAPIEATRVALDAIRVQADLRQAEADSHAARILLATMLEAEAQTELLTPSSPWPVTGRSPANPSTPGEAASERRPDVVAAQRRLEAAQGSRELARALRTRDVTVGVQLDHWPVSATNTSGTGNTVSLSLSVPLFVNHAYEGEAARAEADVVNADEALRRAKLAAGSDLMQARMRVATAAARQRLSAEELAPAAERVAEAAEIAYRRGAISLLEVLEARRSLRAARIERINAEADAAKAAAELDAAGFVLP